MELKTFTSKEDFTKSAVQFITDVILNNQDCHISLSGGSTPKPVYEALSERSGIPFERVSFYQVDERYVPKDHEDSNYKMIYESLIKNVNSPFYYFDTSLPIDEASTRYLGVLSTQFDLTILGLGTDGHFASLFPDSPALHEKNRKTAHTTTDEHAVKDRLTLTVPPIFQSKKILLLLSGTNKKQILDELINSSKTIDELPAKVLLPHPDFTIYFFNQ